MSETDNKRSGSSSSGTRARQNVANRVETGKQKVHEASDAIRGKINEIGEAGVEAVDARPLTAVAGAIAVGAVAAALIPVTRREFESAGPLGERARGLIDTAIHTAKTAGLDHLSAAGLTSAALTSGLGGIIGAIVKNTLLAESEKPRQAAPITEADDTSPVLVATT